MSARSNRRARTPAVRATPGRASWRRRARPLCDGRASATSNPTPGLTSGSGPEVRRDLTASAARRFRSASLMRPVHRRCRQRLASARLGSAGHRRRQGRRRVFGSIFARSMRSRGERGNGSAAIVAFRSSTSARVSSSVRSSIMSASECNGGDKGGRAAILNAPAHNEDRPLIVSRHREPRNDVAGMAGCASLARLSGALHRAMPERDQS